MNITSSRKIACIILNWNGNTEVVDCVRSLLNSHNVNVDILVVDNGSTDGSDIQLLKTFPLINLTKSKHNTGVARGWNTGVRRALEQGAEYVFFLNSDAQVAEDCLKKLLDTIDEHTTAMIVTPRILDSTQDNTIWFDGGKLNIFGDVVHYKFGQKHLPSFDIFRTSFASGCAMLIRSSVFESVGLFDESYFAYSEDADFSFRVLSQGLEILHVPQAIVHHTPSSSVKHNKGRWFRDYYVTRNKILLTRDRLHGIRWFWFLFYFVIVYLIKPISYFLITLQFRRIRALIIALWDAGHRKTFERYS